MLHLPGQSAPVSGFVVVDIAIHVDKTFKYTAITKNGCGAFCIANHCTFARLETRRMSDSQPF